MLKKQHFNPGGNLLMTKGNLSSSEAKKAATEAKVPEVKTTDVKTEVKAEVKAEKTAPVTTKKTAKKEEAKAAPAAEKAPVEAKAETEVKEPAKRGRKPATKKTEGTTTVKKTTTKKAAASAVKEPATKEPAVELYVQFGGNQIDEKKLIEKVLLDCKDQGQKGKAKDIKLYVKPEDNACYYVADGFAGSVDLY
jgi:FtsZ-interacting cell division protein ZipA